MSRIRCRRNIPLVYCSARPFAESGVSAASITASDGVMITTASRLHQLTAQQHARYLQPWPITCNVNITANIAVARNISERSSGVARGRKGRNAPCGIQEGRKSGGASGISRLLGAAKLMSAPVADNPRSWRNPTEEEQVWAWKEKTSGTRRWSREGE